MIRSLLLLALLLATLGSLHAADAIRVVALFNNKAMVEIDGVRQLLTVGSPPTAGVELISSDFEEAVIEVDGERAIFNLSNRVSASFAAVQNIEVRIPRHANGGYITTGQINGQRLEMMIDTGATAVVLSGITAARLGVAYRETGAPLRAETASGEVTAYSVLLDQVGVGGIELDRVEALVIDGENPRTALLGMTFLGRLDLSNQGNVLLLRRRSSP